MCDITPVDDMTAVSVKANMCIDLNGKGLWICVLSPLSVTDIAVKPWIYDGHI